MVGLVCLASAWSLGGAAAQAAESNATQAAERPENAMCLGCHGNEGFAMPGADGKPRPLHVNKDKFGKSVHGKRACVECHKDINEIPHQNIGKHKVSCVQCHETLWETAQKENKTQEFAKLGAVVKQIDKYMHSCAAEQGRPVAHQRHLLQLSRCALRVPGRQYGPGGVAPRHSQYLR